MKTLIKYLISFFCIAAITSLSAALDPYPREVPSSKDQFEKPDSSLALEGTPEEQDSPVRLPRRFFSEQSRLRRLRIDGKTGLDGRVEKIHLENDEDLPGIRAYGLPKKHFRNDGLIERVPLTDRFDGDERNGRLIEAYGVSRKRVEDNGVIERLPSAVDPKTEISRTPNVLSRLRRAISEQSENELDDLEAQDAKVFRPLFVYRQQVAARKRQTRKKHYQQEIHQKSNQRPCKYNRSNNY